MGKNKTHAEYVKELAEKNPNIEVLGIYCGSNIKIPHRCKIDGNTWNVTPSNILRGGGCPECNIKKKRKTHEEYVKELAGINPNIEVIEEYRGLQVNIMHYCLIHNFEWSARPGNLLQGRGCPLCGKDIYKAKKSLTHEEYIKELSEKNPTIKVIEKYSGSSEKITHYCTIHDIYWKTTPRRALNGCGCKMCKSDKFKKTRTKTHLQYVNEVSNITKNIQVIGEYVDASSSILHKCLICGYEWLARPVNILQGRGCPKCANNIKKTHNDYLNELYIKDIDIITLEEYKGANTPILHLCNKHDIEWKITPRDVLAGKGCRECKCEKITSSKLKTDERYKTELEILNVNIIPLEKYIDSRTDILHKCILCGYEWMVSPNNVLYRASCPRCKETSGERKIRLWLEKNDISYEFQKKFNDCRDEKVLPFDFYLPDLNIIVEFDGKQHYVPIKYFGGLEQFEYIQKHDAIKNEYCKNNGISLLRIPYYKYNNIEEELNNFLFI